MGSNQSQSQSSKTQTQSQSNQTQSENDNKVIDKFVNSLNIAKIQGNDFPIKSFADLIFYTSGYNKLKSNYNRTKYRIFIRICKYDLSLYKIFIVYDGFNEEIDLSGDMFFSQGADFLMKYDESLPYRFLPLLELFLIPFDDNSNNITFKINDKFTDEFKLKFREACLRNEFRWQVFENVNLEGQKIILKKNRRRNEIRVKKNIKMSSDQNEATVVHVSREKLLSLWRKTSLKLVDKSVVAQYALDDTKEVLLLFSYMSHSMDSFLIDCCINSQQYRLPYVSQSSQNIEKHDDGINIEEID